MCFIMGDQGKTHHKSLIIRSLFRVSPGAALHRHAKLSTRRVTNWISFNNGAIKTLEPVCPSSSQQPTELKPPARNQDPGVTQPSLSPRSIELATNLREDFTITEKAHTRARCYDLCTGIPISFLLTMFSHQISIVSEV